MSLLKKATACQPANRLDGPLLRSLATKRRLSHLRVGGLAYASQLLVLIPYANKACQSEHCEAALQVCPEMTGAANRTTAVSLRKK